MVGPSDLIWIVGFERWSRRHDTALVIERDSFYHNFLSLPRSKMEISVRSNHEPFVAAKCLLYFMPRSYSTWHCRLFHFSHPWGMCSQMKITRIRRTCQVVLKATVNVNWQNGFSEYAYCFWINIHMKYSLCESFQLSVMSTSCEKCEKAFTIKKQLCQKVSIGILFFDFLLMCIFVFFSEMFRPSGGTFISGWLVTSTELAFVELLFNYNIR